MKVENCFDVASTLVSKKDETLPKTKAATLVAGS